MKNSEELNWKTYESITKYIYETLGSEFNIQILGYGNNCRIKGRSGVKHQIDVLTFNFVNKFRTAIECKYWNKKINKDIVMKLCVIINDAAIQEGIIVSKEGFTKDAEKLANFYGIKLVQLRELNEKDSDLQSKKIDLFKFKQQSYIEIKRPTISQITVLNEDYEKIELTNANQDSTYIEDNNNSLRLFDWVKKFNDFVHENKSSQELTKNYNLNGGFLMMAGNKIPITSISFTGYLKTINETKNNLFTVQDDVWLIMKKLFENKRFLITEAGLIIERNI